MAPETLLSFSSKYFLDNIFSPPRNILPRLWPLSAAQPRENQFPGARDETQRRSRAQQTSGCLWLVSRLWLRASKYPAAVQRVARQTIDKREGAASFQQAVFIIVSPGSIVCLPALLELSFNILPCSINNSPAGYIMCGYCGDH